MVKFMLSKQRWLIFVLLLLLFPASLLADEGAAITLAKDVDIFWVIFAGALVFFMQAGFLMLEAGLVRAKNTINVAIKNLFDFLVGSVGYLVVGYGLMFGISHFNGFAGSGYFLLNGLGTGQELAFFFFQLTFMATAATIVSGAVAERISFSAYIIISIVISVLIYPIFGHWSWGGGWLSSLGFVDFAGSSVVHSIGGWVSLAGVLILGPRKGRFDENGKPQKIYGHNLPVAVLGTMILWFGWIGFNGGSTLALTDDVPSIVVNTFVSASVGGCVAMALSWIMTTHTASVEDTMNGTLAGLVAITANCHVVSVTSSIIIGAVAGILVVGAAALLEKFQIDDVVGAFPVHGVNGMWGTLAVAIFAKPELREGISLTTQLIGIASCAAWAFGVGLVLFLLIRAFHHLRVTDEQEEIGLNVAEHGAKTTMLDLMKEMSAILQNKDFSHSLYVENETEAGTIGRMLNRFIMDFSDVVSALQGNALDLNSHASDLDLSSTTIAESAKAQSEQISELKEVLQEMSGAFDAVETIANAQKNELAEVTVMNGLTKDGFKAVSDVLDTLHANSRNMLTLFAKNEVELKETAENIGKMDSLIRQVRKMVETIFDISEQLNMLAINVSIEAARAGAEGKGFGIVAQEVASLADSASKSADEANRYLGEISESVYAEIDDIRSTVSAFTEMTGEVKKTDGYLTKLMESSVKFSERVDQMGERTDKVDVQSGDVIIKMKECVRLIGTATSAMGEIDSSSDSLARQAGGLKSASGTLNKKSDSLKKIISEFKIQQKEAVAQTMVLNADRLN